MTTVWKFELGVDDKQTIMMPQGAQLLSIHEQYGRLCMWALVESDAIKVPREILILGTGHPAKDLTNYDYVGTAVMCGSSLVWHVWLKIA